MTRFPFYIARRYLFSKKKWGIINIISATSVVGVALATAALVCTLSVFNGFSDLIAGLYTTFDPELQIKPAKGKIVPADDPLLAKVKGDDAVASASECLEDDALILIKGHPLVFRIKGVDDQYANTSGIRDILYQQDGPARDFTLTRADIDYGVPGIGLAAQLGCINFDKPVAPEIYVPRKGERIDMLNPVSSFNFGTLHSTGICFQVHQRKYDENYMLTSLRFAQNLFEQPGCISCLELKLKSGADLSATKARLRTIVGNRYTVRDRAEQQEDTFRIMNIEKLVAYLFLTFIALVACFNIIGSVSMLIIDKKKDVSTLRHLGATDRDICRIFLTEGRLIALLGAAIGVAIGLGLCFLQQKYGLISIGGTGGDFIVDAYPVSIHATDIIVIFATVCAVGFPSVWYPVRYLSKRLVG